MAPPEDEPTTPDPATPVRALDRQDAGKDGRMFAPSAERNGPELLPILQRVLGTAGTLLEVGSGTGQHGAFLAPRFPNWRWLPSDMDPSVFASIRAWRAHASAHTVEEPTALDLTGGEFSAVPTVDAMLCINVLHIAPRAAMPGLFQLAAQRLAPGGVLALYGPLFRANEAPPTSNLEFHQRLLDRDPDFGVWREADLVATAEAHELTVVEVVRMPVNNSTVLLHKPTTP